MKRFTLSILAVVLFTGCDLKPVAEVPGQPVRIKTSGTNMESPVLMFVVDTAIQVLDKVP